MVAVALAFAVLELGGSASAVGLVLACAVFPLVATVLVGGVIATGSSQGRRSARPAGRGPRAESREARRRFVTIAS